jgi:hypothetical protein
MDGNGEWGNISGNGGISRGMGEYLGEYPGNIMFPLLRIATLP